MHIMITGGAGYIGSHVAWVLAEVGHKVTILDNFTNSYPQIVTRLQAEFGEDRIVLAEGDIGDRAFLSSLFAHDIYDAVIHLAALKSIPESLKEADRYHRVNVEGTASLTQAMAEGGVFNLIFGSTAAVYDADQPMPLTEVSTTNSPPSPYGSTKLAAEALLNQAHAADDRWRIAMVRFFNPAGAHPTALIGQVSRAASGGLMESILRAISEPDTAFRIYGTDFETPDGSALRDYIHVMDLAEVLQVLLDSLRHFDRPRVFNVGSGRPISVHQVHAEFETAYQSPIPVVNESPRPGDQPACWCAVDLITAETGWQPKRVLQNMVADELSWNALRLEMLSDMKSRTRTITTPATPDIAARGTVAIMPPRRNAPY